MEVLKHVNASKRPNQDALYQALNIYRDVMRPFILKNLKTVQDLSPKDRFENEAEIDVGDFPYLFREYWHDVFKYLFDPDRDIRSAVGIITEARNKVCSSANGRFPLGDIRTFKTSRNCRYTRANQCA